MIHNLLKNCNLGTVILAHVKCALRNVRWDVRLMVLENEKNFDVKRWTYTCHAAPQCNNQY